MRYMPKIEYEEGNWTHNMFRLWESIAGREEGIRLEMSISAELQKDGTHLFELNFYTIEAVLSHMEGRIRSYLKNLLDFDLSFMRLPSYQLQRGAIAFGSSSNNGAITPAGSDRMLVAAIFNISNDIGAVSFGGTACNQIDTANLDTNRNGYSYMLKAPAASSNSLANVGASNYGVFCYTGVAQNDTAATIDNHGETTGTSTAPSGSLTAVAANAWVWGAIFVNSQVATSSLQMNMSNLTRQPSPSSATYDAGDTGVASGAETQSETLSGSSFWYVAQLSMAPVASGPANLKSYNTNLKANTKSIDTNLIANIKSFDTNV